MPQQHHKPDTFKERFARAVQQSLDRAGKLAPGPQRDILLAKIRQLRQLEAVAAMNNVYRFPRRRPPRRPFKRRFRRRVASRNLTIAALLIAALVLAVPSILQVWHGQRGHALLPATSASDVLTSSITVVDGDTVRAGGARYRLVGFDTPEKGDLAHCDSERALAEKATQRLGELIAGGAALTRVACAVSPAPKAPKPATTAGYAGRLTANGRDVGTILINEGLAHPYVCGASGCPRRPGWC